MRKTIICLAAVLIFTGCSKNGKVSADEISKTFEKDFSAEVTVLCEENETVMTLSKNRVSISFCAESPDEIKGLSTVLYGEHAKVDFEGMELLLKAENLPEKAPFLLLKKLFEGFSSAEKFTVSTEDDFVFIKGGDFSAVLSKEDFSPKSAVFPKYKTEFFFSEWKFSPPE